MGQTQLHVKRRLSTKFKKVGILMSYTMRPLKMGDVFKMSKILKKMNLKIDPNGKTQDQLGAEFVIAAAENLHLAEEEVNDFLGDLVDMPGWEFAALPISEAVDIIKQFKAQPGVANFLSQAGQLTK
jgi:hypothetical protein